MMQDLTPFSCGPIFGHSRYTAWAIPLFGRNFLRGSAHEMATEYQRNNPLSNQAFFAEIMVQSRGALIAAGCDPTDADALVLAAQNFIQELNDGIGLFSL